MTALGFTFDANLTSPLPVDLVLTQEMHDAILEVGKDVLTNLRDPNDFETAASFMAAEGEWLMWCDHRSIELELKRHSEEERYKLILSRLVWWHHGS